MYQLFCDGALLYDLRNPDYALADLKCELEVNKTGSLSFRIAPTHPMYSSIQKMKSEIALYQDGEWARLLPSAEYGGRLSKYHVRHL